MRHLTFLPFTSEPNDGSSRLFTVMETEPRCTDYDCFCTSIPGPSQFCFPRPVTTLQHNITMCE